MRRVLFFATVIAFAFMLPAVSHADCTQVGPITGGNCDQQAPGGTPPPSANTPDTVASERAFYDLINKERSSRGMRTLSYNPVLTDIARKHALHMAQDGKIYHNTAELRSQETQRRLGYPTMIGENVGVGPSTQWLHDEFMRSTEHRENILERRYTAVGLGVVISDGSIWVVQDYMEGGRKIKGAAPPVVSKPALRRALTALPALASMAPRPNIAFLAPRASAVSALILPPIPAPRPLPAPGGKTPPILPLAVLATLSAAGFASRRDGGAWI